MIAAERLEEIIQALRTENVVSTSRLSAELDVSRMTIRRDLARLEEMGLCQRTHGGAVASGRPIVQDTPYKQRELIHVNEKLAIANKTLEYIHDGDTIAVDSGTTTLYFARALREKRNITVITNSVHILLELADRTGISVISTAGSLSRALFEKPGEADPCLVGPLAESTMRKFRPVRAIMATTGLTLTDGMSNSVLEQATMKAVMMEVAAEVILLADHSKFGHAAGSIVGPITLIDRIITDTGISEEFEEGIHEIGIQVNKVEASV